MYAKPSFLGNYNILQIGMIDKNCYLIIPPRKKFSRNFKNYLTKLYKLYIIKIYSLYSANMSGGEQVTVIIDNKSGAPIYDQIYSQIKNQIISGALKENDPLPSIRGLAKDLKISFITTKRAYDELEREGFIYTIQAKGCYVAPKNIELLREENLKRIEELIEEIVRLSAACNLTKKDIAGMIEFALEENNENEEDKK